MPLRYLAFGRTWQADAPLALFSLAAQEPHGPAAISVRQVADLPDRGAPRWHGDGGALYADGLRLAVRDEAVFDLHQSGTIGWQAGSGWTGAFPPELYSVIAGTVHAMLGDLPLHGSAVVIDGRGVLLCGPAGTGKSTLCAGLCAIGARLVSDDLTIIAADRAGQPVMAMGKRSVRLFPDVAQELGLAAETPAYSPRGKVLVYPSAVPADQWWRLDTIVQLEAHSAPPAPVADEGLAQILLRNQFRPLWLGHLPGAGARLALLDTLARNTKVVRFRTRPLGKDDTPMDIAGDIAELVRG